MEVGICSVDLANDFSRNEDVIHNTQFNKLKESEDFRFTQYIHQNCINKLRDLKLSDYIPFSFFILDGEKRQDIGFMLFAINRIENSPQFITKIPFVPNDNQIHYELKYLLIETRLIDLNFLESAFQNALYSLIDKTNTEQDNFVWFSLDGQLYRKKFDVLTKQKEYTFQTESQYFATHILEYFNRDMLFNEQIMGKKRGQL